MNYDPKKENKNPTINKPAQRVEPQKTAPEKSDTRTPQQQKQDRDIKKT